MTQKNADTLKHKDYTQYARLLGFSEHGKHLLKAIKANASVPIITKPAMALKQLDGAARMSLQADLHAAHEDFEAGVEAHDGAHRHNHLPMGTLANRELRRKRIQAHTAFNQLWQSGLMTKRAAYRCLQMQLGLPPEEAHIANFSDWRCEQVIQLCARFLSPCDRAA